MKIRTASRQYRFNSETIVIGFKNGLEMLKNNGDTIQNMGYLPLAWIEENKLKYRVDLTDKLLKACVNYKLEKGI